MIRRYDAPNHFGDETIAYLLKTYPILRYFKYSHLPIPLQEMSEPFHFLAWRSARLNVVNHVEFAVGLRKLLEAKDCIVRSILPPENDG